MTSSLTKLRGIGPKVATWLQQAGIETAQQLAELGAVEAYLQVIEKTDFQPNVCLLYSLVGALEDRDWLDVAHNDKARLLSELEGYADMQRVVESD